VKLRSVAIIVAVATNAWAGQLPSRDASLLHEVDSALQRGLEWLVQQQKPDGSWDHHPAMTALAVTSILRSGKPLTTNQETAVAGALKFILANVRTNGAIYGGSEMDKYPNYSTAICTMALLAAEKPQYAETIRKAREFLVNSQFGDNNKTAPSDPSYGGIGYGKRERPDLSNSQWALEALHLVETHSTEKMPALAPKDDLKLHWTRAVKFLQRCQNLPGHNDQAWVKNATPQDVGGFIYMPGLSFANDGEPVDEQTPLRSYGSMTYAGLKSYIYAELKKDDPRVVAAVNWLKRNYTVAENPGLGAQGLYYYYHTLAKSLTAYGDDTFTDAAGKAHDWRYELMNKLVSLQKADGFWVNENNRWWESNPVLTTSYSLLALEILQARHYP
jgi:squalene-hopene/tetraprenyl-beta-curcumene cyclase